MLTLDQIQERTKEKGTPIADRTFWKYVRLGLLPPGQAIPGKGHKRFFPDNVPNRIVQLDWLNKKVGIPLPVLRKSLLYIREGEHWHSGLMNQEPSPLDVIVTCAGVMANIDLVHKERLSRQDLDSLLERFKHAFDRLSFVRRWEVQHFGRLEEKNENKPK